MPTKGRRRRPDGGTTRSDLTASQLAEMAYDLAKVETRPGVAADLQEAYFHQIEEELAKRQKELNRLKELLQNASRESEPGVREAVHLAEDAVEAQEQKLADYLDDRPWLLENLYNTDTMSDDDEKPQSHLPEKDWRQRLVELMHNKEEEWRQHLQREQEQRVKVWRATEQARMQEQYEQLQQAILERQERLEREWQEKLQSAEHSKLRSWMDDERQQLEQLLSKQMARLEQEALERERNWFKQLGTELEKKEKELHEQHKLELRLLEIEWREQEVIQRERVHLRKLEQDMLDEQRHKMELLTKQLRAELVDSQKEQLTEFLKQQSGSWEQTRGAWHEEINRQNEVALKQLSEAHEHQLENRHRELVEHFGQALQDAQEHIRKTSSAEYEEWFKAQQQALRLATEEWGKHQMDVLGSLSKEWKQCLAHEQSEQRDKWLAAFESFTSELNEARETTVKASLSDVKGSVQLLLRSLRAEFAEDEAKRGEVWREDSTNAINCLQGEWQAARDETMHQWQTLLEQQTGRLQELEQLIEQISSQFALSQAERAEKWSTSSDAAITALHKQIDEYLRVRTSEAVESLTGQLQQHFTSLSEEILHRQQDMLNDIHSKQAEIGDYVNHGFAQAINVSEEKMEQLLTQWQHAMGAWKTETYDSSQQLLAELSQTWGKQIQAYLQQMGQEWQQKRTAEEEEWRAHCSALEQERQQQLDAEQAAMLEVIRKALQARGEELSNELQAMTGATEEQLKHYLTQTAQQVDAELAKMQTVFSTNEEKRERVWQLNSTAALDVVQRKIEQHLAEHSRANDESMVKWRREQAEEFQKLAIQTTDEQAKQRADMVERLEREMSSSLQQIQLEAEQAWSGLFAAWADKQVAGIEQLGEQQQQTLASIVRQWKEEQSEILAAAISEWQVVAAHSLNTETKSWRVALMDAQSEFEQTKQKLLAELQHNIEAEVNRWLGNQVTRVEQVLHELGQIHKDELVRREREWQELRNREVIDLHKQGKEEIATLATQWKEMQQTAQHDFQQRWLDELRLKYEQVVSDWTMSLKEDREQLRHKLDGWQSGVWQELQQHLLSEVDSVESKLTDKQQQQLHSSQATLAKDLQDKWQLLVKRWDESYAAEREQSLGELQVLQDQMRTAFETEILKQLDDHAAKLTATMRDDQNARLNELSQLLTEQQAQSIKQVDDWTREQHVASVQELTGLLAKQQKQGFAEVSELLHQQVSDDLHRLEKEVDAVLQEQLEQAIKELAANINNSLEEMRAEMLERYVQELAQNEQILHADFKQQMELSAESLREEFRQIWQDQAGHYSKLHEGELAEQHGRSLSRFEQSLAQECQKLRNQYEELISELRDGIRHKQEAELKALQEAAYREYRTRLDQIVGELTSNHKQELSKIVQERDAKLVAEIRENLKTEIKKQLEQERQQRLARAAQPEPSRRSKRSRR